MGLQSGAPLAPPVRSGEVRLALGGVRGEDDLREAEGRGRHRGQGRDELSKVKSLKRGVAVSSFFKSVFF